MEVTIKIEAAPPEASAYFWAQQFFPAASVNHAGYFGIQTGGNIRGRVVGKMFIFSMWNADQAEAGPGSVAQRFAGEGVGYSVRRAYAWSEGVSYRFRLEKDGALWWKLTVSDPARGDVYLGRIRITQDVPLGSFFVSFTEYFGNIASCQALRFTRVRFRDFRFGSVAIPANRSAPYGRCATSAKGWTSGNAAVHEVGGLFSGSFQ